VHRKRKGKDKGGKGHLPASGFYKVKEREKNWGRRKGVTCVAKKNFLGIWGTTTGRERIGKKKFLGTKR